MSDRVSLPHVRALDGLRGAAVAGVVLYHGGHLKGGYLGVDLFFVLSGYLITSLLLAEWRGRGRIALGAFWARRARRLLPALVLVMAGVAVYSVVFAEPTELGRIRGDALATIAYVANWRSIFAGQSYFDLFSRPSPLQHTWSLAIEEQFYVFWPLIFVGLVAWWKQRTAQAVLVTALLLGAASAVLMFSLYDQANPNRAYFGADTRSFALFAGIAIAAGIAIWGHAKDPVVRIAIEVIALGGLLALVTMWVTLDGQAPRLYRGGFAVAGVAAALVILASTHPRRGPIGWVLSFPPLCWLGLISYGLYLWHWPVDVVLDADRTGITGWPLFALRTAVALAIAVASYFVVEMPIRRGALRPTQWRVGTPLVAAALLVAIVATTAGAVGPATDSTAFAPHRGDDLLLLGDSLAYSLAPGFAHTGVKFGLGWAPGCRLIHGDIRALKQFSADCPWEYAWQSVIDEVRPTRVLLLQGVWDLFDVRPFRQADFVAPGSPAWDVAFGQQIEKLIKIASRHGAKVTILTLPCTLVLPNAAAQLPLDSGDVRRVVAANAVIRRVAQRHADQVQVADLFTFLCPTGKFQSVIQGVTTRVDGVHLSTAGANLVADWLVPQLGVPTSKSKSSATSTSTTRARR